MKPPEDRWPWLRGGLLGLVPFLLPFVWVVEINSCSDAPRRTELTGVDVVLRFDAEALAVVLPVLAVAIATPFLAARLAGPGPRLLVQAVGLLASAAALWGASFALFFGLFSQRSLRPAGFASLLCFVGLVVDGVLRFALGGRAWLQARRASKDS